MSHWQPPVIPAVRKKRGPLRPPDTSRVFYLDMPEPVKRLEKLNRENKPREPPCSPEQRNHPYPRYAKVIDCDVRFLNEPIVYMETKPTMKKEDHWWPTGKSHIQHYNPSYDRQTTQRTDFQNPACKLTCPPKYICKIPTSCGIGATGPQTNTLTEYSRIQGDCCLQLDGIQRHHRQEQQEFSRSLEEQ